MNMDACSNSAMCVAGGSRCCFLFFADGLWTFGSAGCAFFPFSLLLEWPVSTLSDASWCTCAVSCTSCLSSGGFFRFERHVENNKRIGTVSCSFTGDPRRVANPRALHG